MVRRLAPVTRTNLRAAFPEFTHDQVDDGIKKLVKRGLLRSVSRDQIDPRGPNGRRYVLVDKSPSVPATADSPRSFLSAVTDPSEDNLLGWPPMFVSRFDAPAAPVSRLQTLQRRESDAATGKGWGQGTTVMPGTPSTGRPEFMGRLPGAC
jgi:hypothetical protein